MLVKTLMPRYFRFGESSGALGREGQAFGAVSVVMATVPCASGSSTNRGPSSPKAFALPSSQSPVTIRGEKRGPPCLWLQSSFFGGDNERKGNVCCWVFLNFFKVEWKPLPPLLCSQPRISEIDNLRQHQVIKIQRIYFFIKHMPMLLGGVGFLSFPQTVLCFCW